MKLSGNLAICILVVSGILFPARLVSAEFPENLRFSFGDDPRSEMNISWRMPEAGSGVELVLAEPDESERRFPAHELGNGEGVECHVMLRDLRPASSYRYRIERDGDSGQWHGFSTAPSGSASFSFAVVGDVQGKGRSGKWRRASEWLAERKPAFWVPVGDLVDRGLRQAEWDAFFLDARALSVSSPIMPIIGNHDCYVDKYPEQTPQLFFNQFRLPDESCRRGRGWYSFDYGDAHFVFTNAYPATGDRGRDREIIEKTQRQWLAEDLAAAKARWVFLFCHPPLYSSGPHGGDSSWLNDAWGELIDEYVDLVFTGHTHAFEISHPLKGGKRVAPGEGPIYYNTAGINYSAAAKGDWFTAFKLDKQALITLVNMGGDEPVVETWDWQSGELVHSFKVPAGKRRNLSR